MPKTIVAATTAAVAVADSPIVTVDSVANAVLVITSGLAGVEAIDIYVNTIGSAYEVLLDSTGTTVSLSLATGNAILLNSPGNYKFLKGITAGTVGISTSSPSQV